MADEKKSGAMIASPPKDLQGVDVKAGPGTELALPQGIKLDPYKDVSRKPFKQEAQTILQAPVDSVDVEIRPDGILYLPEIKYRRTLMRAFGAGGWALVPRGEITMVDQSMSREYALYIGGQFAAEARGEQDYFENNDRMTYATAAEAVKSNALVRCCKDLGIASELWDPGFIEKWKAQHAVQVWRKSQQKPQWRRKDREKFYDETGFVNETAAPDRPSTPAKPQGPGGTGTIANPWIGEIAEVTSKEVTIKKGQNAGKKTTVFRIVSKQGIYFGTYSESHADVAQSCAKTGERCVVRWKQSQYGPQAEQVEVEGMTAPEDGPEEGDGRDE